MSNTNGARHAGCAASPDRPAVYQMTAPLGQERQTAMDAMKTYTDAGLAEWVCHGNCPQLHFTDGRIYIFGPYGVTRLA